MTSLRKLAPRAALAAVAAATLAFAGEVAAATPVTGSGKAATEERNPAGYRGVALSIPGQVEVVQDGREAVSITADDNVLPIIETVVEDGILHIRIRKDHSLRTRTPITAKVHARAIESLAIAGSGDLTAAALDTPKLAVRISGSGDVKVGGRAGSVEVRVSGSGDVDATRLEAKRASVRISGSGDVSVWAREALEAHVAGSGDVRYYGDPEVARRIAGSGSVRRAGAAPG